MANNTYDEKIKYSLQDAVETIQITLEKLKQQQQISTTDALLENSTLNVNINTFSCSADDDTLLDVLTAQIQKIFYEYLLNVSDDYREYILNVLFEYHYDREELKFKENLTMNILHVFRIDLEALRDSFDAFQAAWSGDLSAVKVFISKYPTYKDKPGPWGTTLLYSAAKNNYMPLVEYLLTEAKCSVNAQNQQHIEKALLNETITASDYQVAPKLGSTALHAACFGGYLKTVQYLIEHGANYFIKNQAEETPIMNGEIHTHITEYFRNFLNLGYTKQNDSLPSSPIIEGSNQPIKDCIWECRPFSDSEWSVFDIDVTKELNESLIVQPGEQFKQEIYVRVASSIYTVSTIQFLRSGRSTDQKEDLAWIRCRGSSILNFDCYAIWQILLMKHPQFKSDIATCLEAIDLSTLEDQVSLVQLEAWYNSDAKTNELLDQAMNNRRRQVNLFVNGLTDDELRFDLMKFSFNNKKGTISGFIRWIPKLVSNNEHNKHRIANIDNFQTLTNLQPIPLTTRHLREVSQITHINAVEQEPIDDDYESSNNFNIDDDPYDSKRRENKTNKSSGEHLISLDTMTTNEDTAAPMTINLTELENEVNADDYFSKNKAEINALQESCLIEITEPSIDLNVLKQKLAELDDEENNLQKSLDVETVQIQIQDYTNNEIEERRQEELRAMQTQISALHVQQIEMEQSWSSIKANIDEKYNKEREEQEQKLCTALDQITRLNEEIQHSQKKQETLRQIGKNIRTSTHNNIHPQLMQDFVMPKFELLVNHLKQSVKNVDEHFDGLLPTVVFQEKDATYTIFVNGFSDHHTTFDAILRRIINLSNSNNSAKEFYQRHLNRITRSIIRTLMEVKAETHCWKQYVKNLIQLLEGKNTEYLNRFHNYIGEKSKSLIEQSILGISNPPWVELRTYTNHFLEQNLIEEEIEQLKHQALDEFIKQNISFQRLKVEKPPTVQSVNTMKHFITQIKTTLITNPEYQGHEVQHFGLIPGLLQQLMIYYSCFTVQLPLFELSRALLDKIETHTITTITTSTGSGKSSLLPALLIAEGYDRVIVTQPRRLPCTLISQRVNETIATDTTDTQQKLAGWAVSGDEHNVKAKILYLTDGLLKERLLYDENFITAYTRVHKSIVFFIDEVHERSVNIDLCLALLARLLTIRPVLASKMKLIISSATLDQSVPRLFSQIPNVGFTEFQMPQLGLLYPVTKIGRPKENILDIVQELYSKRQRNDQILCFVNSVSEVNQCCRLLAEISHGAIVAFPLIQSQSASAQKSHIENGSVFFSTTVAETSLTFPSLKYVIDTGMINIPMFNPESKRTVLEQVRAAESTIKQRLGRLGRTRPGEYYYLYDFRVEDKPYPTPHICLSDLTNIEFSLRRSFMKTGLHHMQQFLPDKPTPSAINATVAELRRLSILQAAPNNQFTEHGDSLAKLPDLGSLAMAKAVLAALQINNCGRDLICLSSILSTLNTTAVLKGLPQSMKSPDGDFMTLLNVMNEVLLVKQSTRLSQFKLSDVCQARGLNSVHHIIGQALRRYTNLEKLFSVSNDYREKAHIQSGSWKLIAQSLLAGYSDNVFVSMKELHERTHRFGRYKDITDIALLDLQSTLTRPISQSPVSVVLARDIRYSTAVRSTAIISFVGEIKPAWVQYQLLRTITLSIGEKSHLHSKNIFTIVRSLISNLANLLRNDQPVVLQGTVGPVLRDELYLRKEMVTTETFTLENKYKQDTADFENLSRNLKSVTKMTYIFQPMQWRWEAEKQVKITVNNSPAMNTCEITVEGRDSDNQKVKKEFHSFLSWLKCCVVIRPPNAGVLPRLLHPKLRKMYPEIEKKITHITNSERTMVDLYKDVKSTNATRETRMEVVAWIAVCKFQCKLEGGFVRDWIVGNNIKRPATLLHKPKGWVQYQSNANGELIPLMDKEVVPADLDCHLPCHAYFDIDRFQDELYKFDITCKVFREDWRYVLLIDEDVPTGPFTMDLIEPHVALTHDRIDFDVSNLSLEKDYPREIGMRVDITQPPYSIELETIVENIVNKRFRVLRPIDHSVQYRIDKMVKRQWRQVGDPIDYIPRPHPKHYALLVPLPLSSTLYQALSQIIKKISTKVQIVSIEEIKNPLLEDTYEAMKKIIARQCPGLNPNEQKLFHGTKGPGIKGIVEDGYDDRFFNRTGAWGCGAYFADDPRKSHSFTASEGYNQTHVMFYNKVTLGKESIQNAADNQLTAAPKDYHSVRGTAFQYCEYIVYRYGQALPYLKITYKLI